MAESYQGHRERMRTRFREHGLDNFSDRDVLELLLYYVIPRRDVRPIAAALLSTFGSLYGVFEASVDALAQVQGVGEHAATLLRLVPQVSRRYLISRSADIVFLTNSERAGEYLVPRLLFEREEVVLLACLDGKSRLLGCTELSRGETAGTAISIRRIVETALARNASKVILAHNHTSGIALPSQEDVDTTKKIRDALHLVSIELVDHLVVADNDFVSMRDSHMLD